MATKTKPMPATKRKAAKEKPLTMAEFRKFICRFGPCFQANEYLSTRRTFRGAWKNCPQILWKRWVTARVPGLRPSCRTLNLWWNSPETSNDELVNRILPFEIVEAAIREEVRRAR